VADGIFAREEKVGGSAADDADLVTGDVTAGEAATVEDGGADGAEVVGGDAFAPDLIVLVEIAGRVAGEEVAGSGASRAWAAWREALRSECRAGFEVVDNLEAFGDLHFIRGIVGLKAQLSQGGVGRDEAGGFAQINCAACLP